MTATIHPIDFARTSAETRRGPKCARNVPGCIPPASGDNTLPEALEPLAAVIAADLRTGLYDELLDLHERAHDVRCNKPHLPVGAIADVIEDSLMVLRLELDAVILRLARRQALAEAQSLADSFDTMSPEEAIAAFRGLSPAERRAVTWVMDQAGTPGPGAAA